MSLVVNTERLIQIHLTKGDTAIVSPVIPVHIKTGGHLSH